MPRMKVMEAVIKILEDEGVEAIFGIPGAGILPFYSALRGSTKIKHYLARHEEGAWVVASRVSVPWLTPMPSVSSCSKRFWR